jgi:hypothetical protein
MIDNYWIQQYFVASLISFPTYNMERAAFVDNDMMITPGGYPDILHQTSVIGGMIGRFANTSIVLVHSVFLCRDVPLLLAVTPSNVV